MRRLFRFPLNLAALFSLLALLGVCLLWERGRRAEDVAWFWGSRVAAADPDSDPYPYPYVLVECHPGWLRLHVKTADGPDLPPSTWLRPGEARWAGVHHTFSSGQEDPNPVLGFPPAAPPPWYGLRVQRSERWGRWLRLGNDASGPAEPRRVKIREWDAVVRDGLVALLALVPAARLLVPVLRRAFRARRRGRGRPGREVPVGAANRDGATGRGLRGRAAPLATALCLLGLAALVPLWAVSDRAAWNFSRVSHGTVPAGGGSYRPAYRDTAVELSRGAIRVGDHRCVSIVAVEPHPPGDTGYLISRTPPQPEPAIGAPSDSVHVRGLGFQLTRRTFSNPATLKAPATQDTFWYVRVPLWSCAAALTLLPLVRLAGRVRRWRRARAGRCVRCGYDLRASAGRCPECGAPAEREGTIRRRTPLAFLGILWCSPAGESPAKSGPSS